MKIIKYIVVFFYKVSGVKAVVSMVESALLNYRLRVRMVPTSYKLFIFLIGMIIGGSGVFVWLEAPKTLKSQVYEITNKPLIAEAMGTNEVKELTIEEKIAQAFPENPKVMIAIAKAESNLDPNATNVNTNGSTDTGLFQINSIHGEDELSLFDVDKNIAVARKIYDKQGLSAWSVFNNKSFLKHM